MTLVTGFLGAGKTTVINHLLREQKERKLAVIENEAALLTVLPLALVVGHCHCDYHSLTAASPYVHKRESWLLHVGGS